MRERTGKNKSMTESINRKYTVARVGLRESVCVCVCVYVRAPEFVAASFSHMQMKASAQR